MKQFAMLAGLVAVLSLGAYGMHAATTHANDSKEVATAATAADAPKAVAPAVKAAKPALASTGGVQGTDWDSLSDVDRNDAQEAVFGDDIKKMDTHPVSITGFMVPYETYDDMAEFLLVKQPIGCYFCSPPPPEEVVFIRMKQDKTATLSNDPIKVTGTMHLWKKTSDFPEHQFFIYIMDDAKYAQATPEEATAAMGGIGTSN